MSKDQFISAAALLNPQTRYSCPTRSQPRLYFKHHIYTAKLITLLLTTLLAKPDHDERNIKLIVDPQKRLLFAQAGPQGVYIPSHKSMVSALMKPNVLTAATAYQTKGKIIGLSNENLDFNTSVESLLWAVIIMHITNVPMDTNLSIIEANDGSSFELTPTDFDEIISHLPIHLLQLLLHANRDAKVIVRESASSRNGSFPNQSGHHLIESHPDDIIIKAVHSKI